MGTWGAGLYSNDFAEDFQPTIKAVLRLPFSIKRLVELICDLEPEAANDSDDEDHTTFWLVLADQFHKRGINSRDVFSRAKKIIRAGSDLKMHAELGMSPADLKQRAKTLEKLVEKLSTPPPSKPRKTLAEPEPFLFNKGDLFTIPMSKSEETLNPYMPASITREEWKHEKWGAGIILDCGRAFDYLAWYWPAKLVQLFPKSQQPDTDSLLGNLEWRLATPGTCPKTHFKKMQLEIVDNLKVSASKSKPLFKGYADLNQPPGDYNAIHDIAICNFLAPSIDTDLPHIDGLKTILKA